MSWSIEDSNVIQITLKETLNSLEKYKDSKDDVKTIVNAFGQICYSMGYETGYACGQIHAKRGKDERIPRDKISLNSINERKG
jgi:hypothetical protein